MKPYRTIEDVLRSPWAELAPPTEAEIPVSDRVLRSTRLEDSIYADMRDGDDTLLQIEQTAGEKLRSFPALSRDVYQSFYAITPKKAEESGLSAATCSDCTVSVLASASTIRPCEVRHSCHFSLEK